jgi:N-acetylneuraminate synthase
MNLFFIAEIGINHNGDIEIAKKLIDVAVEAGCDAVKFQKRSVDIVYSAEVLTSPRESPWGSTTRAQKEGLEFGKNEYDIIDTYCKKKGILWSASAWDIPSFEFLYQYHLPFHKIASAMLQHGSFLTSVASEKKKTYISTGMATFSDIDFAVKIFKKNDCPFVLMHTVSTYPSEDYECNLALIQELQARYNCPVGYSGHEADLLPSLIAVGLGACCIERHITLSKTMYGSDQAASLEPSELKELVRLSRRIPGVIGSSEKKISARESTISKKLKYYLE